MTHWELLVFLGLIIIGGMSMGTLHQNAKNTPRKSYKSKSTQYGVPHKSNPKQTISQNKLDAISGLRSLGFDKETATIKIKELPDNLSLETMIKMGLNN